MSSLRMVQLKTLQGNLLLLLQIRNQRATGVEEKYFKRYMAFDYFHNEGS